MIQKKIQPNVPAVIIPVTAGNLILPKNIIAELMPIDDSNTYQSHHLDWINLHGQAIPLVSLSQLSPFFSNDQTDPLALIVHSIHKYDEYPLLAIRVKGSPHNVDVSEEMLRDDHKQDTKHCTYVACHIRVANLPCMLLDLPVIEQSIVEMIHFHNKYETSQQ